jgi:hypothetical protein
MQERLAFRRKNIENRQDISILTAHTTLHHEDEERLPVYPCSTGARPAEVTGWHTQVKIAKDNICSLMLLIAMSYG